MGPWALTLFIPADDSLIQFQTADVMDILIDNKACYQEKKEKK